MSVHKKLMAARLALQAVKLKKSGLNKFAGYSYFELGDFVPTVQEIFHKEGLCGTISYGIEMATLTITDTDDMTSLEITSPMSSAALKGCHEVQNLGAVETYIRRYLWVTAMEIVEHDALEATTGKEKPEAKKASISDAIKALKASTTDDEFKAAWRAQVTKFAPQTDDYEALKSAGAMHRTSLAQKEMASA
jgi:hypothetical protein